MPVDYLSDNYMYKQRGKRPKRMPRFMPFKNSYDNGFYNSKLAYEKLHRKLFGTRSYKELSNEEQTVLVNEFIDKFKADSKETLKEYKNRTYFGLKAEWKAERTTK
ncbi:hypothetical protein [Halobacillus ihumii]|uniref:hypothetical protein n=1 Tax=Halobacillus ihumii TaxID=2686092 RepID=UPI0013D6B64E|nr:hypothetical protein [Halobacillus ihumii]